MHERRIEEEDECLVREPSVGAFEPGREQRVHQLLRHRHYFGVGAVDERKGRWVPRAQLRPRAADGLDASAPVGGLVRLEPELGEDLRADRGEEVVLGADVRVERHRLDSEQ